MPSLVTRGIKTNIAASTKTSFTPQRTSNALANLGRVTRVVLGRESCTEEEWNRYQRSQALYGVFYKRLQVGTDGQLIEVGAEEFAYCYFSNLRRIPVPNEIVRISLDLAPDLVAQDDNISRQKNCWIDIVPAWNHPHLNTLPNLQKNAAEVTDGNFVDQGNDVNPLQLCPGDISLEGRHGESLRFGGTWYTGSPVAVEGTNGKAYAILRVGQGTDNDGQGDKAVYEDVNRDLASIYFTTAHIIPLNQAFIKRKSWGKDPKVTEAKDYNKPQILLTSDRLWLNGRDDIELSAKNSIGLTAGQVNIDGQEQVSLDATKVYLGDKSQDEKEPVLKGQTTTDMLSKLIDQFKHLLDTIVTAGKEGAGDPGVFIGVLQTDAEILKKSLESYQEQLPTLHSKKVFTE